MFSFTVNGKEYKVKYGYGVLCNSDLIDKVTSIGQENNGFKGAMKTVAELILAGLQKCHKDEFGYETESEEETALAKVYDLMDEYEEESTEENPQSGYTLFEKCNEELMKNGFLSAMTKHAEENAKKQDATVIPQDHKQKKKN